MTTNKFAEKDHLLSIYWSFLANIFVNFVVVLVPHFSKVHNDIIGFTYLSNLFIWHHAHCTIYSILNNAYSISVFLQHGINWPYKWEVLFQKQVSRAGTSNYIPRILWDVITCPCPWYLLLAQHSWNIPTGWFNPFNSNTSHSLGAFILPDQEHARGSHFRIDIASCWWKKSHYGERTVARSVNLNPVWTLGILVLGPVSI